MMPFPTPSLPNFITSRISKPIFRRDLSFSAGILSIRGDARGAVESLAPGVAVEEEAAGRQCGLSSDCGLSAPCRGDLGGGIPLMHVWRM